MLSTGQAAALCSVTPDAVLKWIKAGKIPASRTPGGHYRVPEEALLSALGAEKRSSPPEQKSSGRAFQYCWEFNARAGKVQEGCLHCLVYHSRAKRCFEMSQLPTEAGHAKVFCENTCEDCDYYQKVNDRPVNVLVVTDRPELRMALEADAKGGDYELRFTDCEYQCSMTVEDYRPDYVVIDCSMGHGRSREFAGHLSDDPRIPFARIILAGNREDFPKECDKVVFAYIERHFTLTELKELIGDFRGSRSDALA